MKIFIEQIPPEGQTLTETMSVEVGDGQQAEVQVNIHVEKLEDTVYIRGNADAHVPMTCGRCLKEFTGDIGFPLELAYFPMEEMTEEESHELTSEEIGAGFYIEDEIDISDVVQEQLLLNIPMRPLCDETCKGMCPHCGQNLNEGQCTCEQKTVDPRLAGLKKFLEKGKE